VARRVGGVRLLHPLHPQGEGRLRFRCRVELQAEVAQSDGLAMSGLATGGRCLFEEGTDLSLTVFFKAQLTFEVAVMSNLAFLEEEAMGGGAKTAIHGRAADGLGRDGDVGPTAFAVEAHPTVLRLQFATTEMALEAEGVRIEKQIVDTVAAQEGIGIIER